jgi:hypothetical protein
LSGGIGQAGPDALEGQLGKAGKEFIDGLLRGGRKK